MKRERKRSRLAEGWLIIAALALAALMILLADLSRRPPTIVAAPVHSLDAAVFVTPAPAPIDLNRATDVELAQLPGIGEALAKRIVEYRAEWGFFGSVEALDDVPGIGEGKINAIRKLVFCGQME